MKKKDFCFKCNTEFEFDTKDYTYIARCPNCGSDVMISPEIEKDEDIERVIKKHTVKFDSRRKFDTSKED
jgi:DNA-directed RNA polymerase subunit RPC12/RpoP